MHRTACPLGQHVGPDAPTVTARMRWREEQHSWSPDDGALSLSTDGTPSLLPGPHVTGLTWAQIRLAQGTDVNSRRCGRSILQSWQGADPSMSRVLPHRAGECDQKVRTDAAPGAVPAQSAHTGPTALATTPARLYRGLAGKYDLSDAAPTSIARAR